MKTKTIFLAGLLSALFAGFAAAGSSADEAAIRKALADFPVEEIQDTPVPGVYEVTIGPHIVYITADGRYMFQGELIDVEKRQSLTEPRQRQVVSRLMASVSEDDMIVYAPDKPRYTISVFTDIDCGYCRKLHSEMQNYLDAGIRVRYLFFPRAGAGSPSWKKAEAVWCAGDRKAALTAAKNGKAIDMKTCSNPIAEHMRLVEKLGARGTPFIVFEDGSTQPGYVPAKQMSQLLEHMAAR